jgi:hypothetical protein
MVGLLVAGQATQPVRASRVLALALPGLLALGLPPASAGIHFGMVSDNGADRVALFNADRDAVTASTDTIPGPAVGDCVMLSAGDVGFSSSSSGAIAVLEIEQDSIATVRATGVIPISNPGVDLSLSPDDAFLVMAGGGALQQPLSVVDTALRAEVATAGPFIDHTSVEFCDDGTLLLTTTFGQYFGDGLDNALYDAAIDGAGGISLRGHRVSSGTRPNNSVCAPGSLSGVLLDRDGGVTAFSLPDLEIIDRQRTRGTTAQAAAFSDDGRRLYVRTPETIEAFDFDPVAGLMSADWVRHAPGSLPYYGMEQIALHPRGDKLYVDGGGSLLILDPRNGRRFGEIPMDDTTGICFASADRRPGEGEVARLAALPAPAVP